MVCWFILDRYRAELQHSQFANCELRIANCELRKSTPLREKDLIVDHGENIENACKKEVVNYLKLPKVPKLRANFKLHPSFFLTFFGHGNYSGVSQSSEFVELDPPVFTWTPPLFCQPS